MKESDSPVEGKSLESCTVGEFLDVLASDAVMPGAGAAAGIALALAASCAGKAAAITLNHKGEKSSEIIALQKLRAQLSELADLALILGRNDALQFKRLQVSNNDPDDSRDLLETDRQMLNGCQILDTLLDANEQFISRNMKGDWLAARVLGKACQDIHRGNVHELEE